MLVALRLAKDSGETALARRFGLEVRGLEEQTRGLGSLLFGDLDDVAWRYCDLTRERCAVVRSTDKQIQWAKRSRYLGFLQALKDRTRLRSKSSLHGHQTGAVCSERAICAASW
jgi:hypothetical protein